jgi:dTDP-4-dehydrorhamnose reductase
MILVLGGSGYIGAAFLRELKRRNWPFQNLSRSRANYADFETLRTVLQQYRPEFVINCAGYTGKPNVDACERAKADTLAGNVVLPATIAHACAAECIPWGHVGSGCIYNGAKVGQGTDMRVEKDLTQRVIREWVEFAPEKIQGFTEEDEPNFSFRAEPCSFYSGSKALGEESIEGLGESYVWRLRIPFDEFDNGRNYLTKLQRYSKVYDNVNSISHRGDAVNACLDLWARRAPFGVYHVTNPGFVTTRQVIAAISRTVCPRRVFEYWESDEEFYRVAAGTRRSNCVLDSKKLLATGVKMRPVEEALEDSLQRWVPEPSTKAVTNGDLE